MSVWRNSDSESKELELCRQNMYLCNISNSNPEGVSEPKKPMLYEHFAPEPRFGAVVISHKIRGLSMQSLYDSGGICCVNKERQGS